MKPKHIHIEQSTSTWIQRIIDFGLPILVLYIIAMQYLSDWTSGYALIGLLGCILFLTLCQYFGVYKNFELSKIYSGSTSTFFAWIVSWSLIIVVLFLNKWSETYSRLVFIVWGISTPVAVICIKLIFHKVILRLHKNISQKTSVAIIGMNDLSKQLLRAIKNSHSKNIAVRGIYFEGEEITKDAKSFAGIPIKGNIEQLIKNTQKHTYDEIYICLPLKQEDEIKNIITQLSDSTAIVKFVPDLFGFDLMHSKFSIIDGMPIFSIYDTPLSSNFNKLLKRLEDVVISFGILTLLCPLFLPVSLLIKVDSRGPIFYRQKRISWNGKVFDMLKFRSMPIDTEDQGVKWGNSKNKKATKFGRYIRKLSIDELPQFINVLKGDMSIVGPRPEREEFVKEFRKEIPRYMQKHLVKGGISGWAQVNGLRGDTSLEKRIEFDLYYINNWSLGLDIKIILLTAIKIFTDKNAY